MINRVTATRMLCGAADSAPDLVRFAGPCLTGKDLSRKTGPGPDASAIAGSGPECQAPETQL